MIIQSSPWLGEPDRHQLCHIFQYLVSTFEAYLIIRQLAFRCHDPYPRRPRLRLRPHRPLPQHFFITGTKCVASQAATLLAFLDTLRRTPGMVPIKSDSGNVTEVWMG